MSRAVLVLASDAIKAKAHHWIDRAPWNTRVTFQGPQRTIEQNAKMWAMLTDVSEQLEWFGQKYPPQDWKDYMMHALKRARWMPYEDGGMVPVGMSTSDLSREEASDLIEVIYAFGAAHDVKWSEPPSQPESYAETALPALSAPQDAPMEIVGPDIGEREYEEAYVEAEAGAQGARQDRAGNARNGGASADADGVGSGRPNDSPNGADISTPDDANVLDQRRAVEDGGPFDPLEWAAAYNRSLAEWFDAEALKADWDENFAKRKTLAATRPGTAAALKNEVMARIGELGAK